MNIKFNFATQNVVNQVVENQELAVMPAALAQKLLRIYANNLSTDTSDSIIQDHINTLRNCQRERDLDGAIKASLAWVAERDLIQNIVHENWDAYKVETENSTEAAILHVSAH